MADDTKLATMRSNSTNGTNQIKVSVGSSTQTLDILVEVAAAASVASTYTMCRLPMHARIHGNSVLATDDLASTGSPTFDIGFKPVGANFTADVDALNDGIDVFTAALTNTRVIKTLDNYGKMVWEHLGLASDPGGFADLTMTILDAAMNSGGTVVMTLVYSVD